MKLLIALCCLALVACEYPSQFRLECQLDGTPTMSSEVVEGIGYYDNAYHLWASKDAKYVYIPRPGEACVIKTLPRKP